MSKLERIVKVINPGWFSRLFGRNAAPAYTAAQDCIADREAERAAVLERLRATVRRGDTRAQHDAYTAAKLATIAALRAEVR